MATTALERLLFLQGGLCFFCNLPLPKADASVEHLQAVANGGTNHDDNCVACCKAVNRVLGSMGLKGKIQVVLNQKGNFRCPNSAKDASPSKPAARIAAPAKKPDAFALVVANLKQRGANRPRTSKTLTSTISALLAQHKSLESAAGLIGKLEAAGMVVISERKVTYAF
jgi:hypothetical protein